jgi:hypothetical protein
LIIEKNYGLSFIFASFRPSGEHTSADFKYPVQRTSTCIFMGGSREVPAVRNPLPAESALFLGESALFVEVTSMQVCECIGEEWKSPTPDNLA